MTPLGENFRGNQRHVLCPLCNNHLDNQPGLLQCAIIKEKVEINLKMEDMMDENVNLEKAKKLTEILNLREKMMKEN